MFIFSVLKFISFFIRRFTKFNATALPGLILEKYFPYKIPKLISSLEKVIIITGTNGKTTTTKLITYILQQNNYKFITNKSGSNLVRGILTSLIDSCDIFGNLNAKIGIFEIEEGSFRKLVHYVKPNMVIVTNIFRDQLDAYGEIDKTFEYIKDGIKNSNNPILVLNGDDDRVKLLRNFTTNKVFEIKLDKYLKGLIKFEKINYVNLEKTKKSSNLVNKFYIKDFKLSFESNQKVSCNFNLIGSDISFFEIKVPLFGLFSAINASFAIIATYVFFDIRFFNFSNFQPAFGRGEEIVLQTNNNEKIFRIFLSKNPAGLNLNLTTLSFVRDIDVLVLILNDNIADGRDISWIWDCDFSLIHKVNFKKLVITGTRSWDLALRLLYEGLNISVQNVFEDINLCLKSLIKDKDIENIYVLSTYTATLEFRDELKKHTNVNKIWKHE